jgi:hypothetical protein
MDKQHQQRVSLAQKNYKDFQTYTGILATGIDPDTGEQLEAHKAQHYMDLWEHGKAELEKTAGVNKDVKGKLQKLYMLAEHIIKVHPKAGAGGPGAGGGGGQDAGAGGGAPSSRMTPPPSATQSLEQNADAPRLRQEMADQREFNLWKKQQEVLRDMRIAEEKAKSETPGSARAYEGHPWSVQDAKAAASSGNEQFKEFLNAQGEPIDIGKLPDDQVLYPVYLSKGKMYWRVGSSPKTNTTYDNVVHRGSRFDATGGAAKGASRVPTTSASEQGIDPVTGTTKTRRTTTPVTGATGAGASRTAPPPTPGARSGAGAGTGGGDLLPTNATAKRIAPVRGAATQLFGDPTQPSVKGLKDYAYLADQPERAKRIGSAVQLVLNGLDQQEKAAGSFVRLLQNYGGVPQALIDSQLTVNKDVIGKLNAEDAEAFNTIISSISTVVGLRSLTTASAAQASVKALERDIPIPGYNTFTSKQFNFKLSRLAEEVYSGSRTVPLPKEEREFIKKQVEILKNAPAGGTKPRGTPPPAPGAAHPLDDEIKKAVAEAKKKAA